MLDYLSKRIKIGITYLFISTYFILKNELLFDIYMMVISLLCFWEFLSIYNNHKMVKITTIYLSIISLIIEIYYNIIGKNIIISLILFPILLLIYYFSFFSEKNTININNLYQIFFGWIYIEMPFFIFRYVYHLNISKNIIIGLITLLCINDNIYYYLNNNKVKIQKYIYNFSFFNENIEILIYNISYILIFGIIFYLIGNYNFDWIIFSLIIPLLTPISNYIYNNIITYNGIKYTNNIIPGYNCFLDFFKNFILASSIILGIFFI